MSSNGGGVIVTGGDNNQFPLDDHVMRSMDWDSIMKELEFDDDSAPNLKSNFPTSAISPHFVTAVDPPPLPFFPDQFHPPEFPGHGYGFNSIENNEGGGFDFVEDLIRVVDSVDSDELKLAQVILSRLN